MRALDKLKLWFRSQDLPKYQNLYLGKERGQLQAKHGGGIVTVTGCHYSSELGSYMYWCNAGGVMVCIPESYLEPLRG